MIKPFDVLERSLDLRRNYLLEASAGTGKTFSIQHLVVRLLVEPQGEEGPASIDKILVVTFTRAATRDLRIRIRKNIEDALHMLESCPDQQGNMPDYLKACVEKGEQAVKYAKKHLQQALFLFDQAQIFTIHSFCARLLRQFSMESDTGLHTSLGDKPLPRSELLAAIRDFFRTEIRQGKFSPLQLGKYLSKDPDQTKLLKIIQNGHELIPTPTFEQLVSEFQVIMRDLKASNSLAADRMIEDFQQQAPAYKNYSKEAKAETLEKVCRFAKLFDKDQWTGDDLDGLMADGVVWAKALDPELLKSCPIDPSELFYPDLTKQLSAKLAPLVEKGGDFSLILARLAQECRQHLIRYQQEEEKFSPDDALRNMQDALDHPLFATKARAHYQAVIVDEFQDTDPLQWNIFSRLFLPADSSWKGNLYLVGDPKQSIYSFRQADIYTYLSAAKAIGKHNCLSLNVNYRSQAPLVQALNLLFSQEHLPSFMPLPKHACYLLYHPVRAAKGEQLLDDEKGAVHFVIADCQPIKKPSFQLLEETVFFPFIVAEIFRLKDRNGLSNRQFAVLVRDRRQASRLTAYFQQMDLPFSNQRGTSLARSAALQALTAMIQAILHPRDRGKIVAAFGSPLWGWTREELAHPEWMEFVLLMIHKLRSSLKEKGFTFFMQDLLHSMNKPQGQTVMEYLLSRKDGLEFYRDMQQLADCIADHQYDEWNSPEGIIPFLDQLQQWEKDEDERAKRFEDPGKEGVKILTIHSSKGLEFDVVFALGLMNRDEIKEDLIPSELEGRTILAPRDEKSPAYHRYCEERDSEKMRQLYVALTRAKHQLYLPAVLHYPSEQLKWGEASPLDLFLARLHQPPASYQTLYERIRSQAGNALSDFLEEFGKNNSITYSIHQEVSCHFKPGQRADAAPSLQAPPCVTVPGKQIWMASFTSLSQHTEQAAGNKSTHPLNYPSDFSCSMKDAYSLPASSETGVIIHRILEKLSFCDFDPLEEPEQAIPLIRPYLHQTPFKDWEHAIAKLIFNTLKAALPALPASFSLSKLKPGNLYREMSFLFPYQKGEGIENLSFNGGLIKGVIDMLFCYEDRYFLVDWKTNWLGHHMQYYETASLYGAMQENAYFLQASIYSEAIRRYLKLVDPRQFEDCFGGAYYLFLRGMQPGQAAGAYHFFPEIDSYANFIH